tara:strand:- start:1123 stop:1803 length:681 start_codon:yes stop_codon:yes gene_type:complete
MAFTPVTIPAGNVLATNASGQGVQDNLDKMKNYIDGGVASADLATDSWAQAKHIMRGNYNPITNSHTFVSGINAGYLSATSEMSFVGDGPTSRGAPAEPQEVSFPNTAIDFFLRSNADVLFQFTAYPITPGSDEVSGSGDSNPLSTASVYLDGDKKSETKVSTRLIHDGANRNQDAWLSHNWNVWSGFFIAKNLAAGQHSFDIRGEVGGRYTFLMNFSVSFEAFYR